jgi:homoaconitase/3-isopropylmalate dehydratase large subunit
MGLGGEGYLASPQVVAASALAGFIAAPDDLGLTWDPSAFGIR